MHIVSGNVYAVPTSVAEKAIAEPEPIVEEAVEPVVVEPVEVVAPEPEVITQAVTETYEATAYIAMCDTGCSGITATGVDVRNSIYTTDGLRIIATDPAVVPMYSIVTVTLADGTSFKAQALDTGGAIRGNRIDILVASRSEAITLGRQAVEIEVIRRGSD